MAHKIIQFINNSSWFNQLIKETRCSFFWLVYTFEIGLWFAIIIGAILNKSDFY